NTRNQVFISYDEDTPNLNGDVILRGHPGLESYEFTSDGWAMHVPSGITMTVEAGATITGEYQISVDGHLETSGSINSPSKIYGPYPVLFGSSGSADIKNTIFEGTGFDNFGIEI